MKNLKVFGLALILLYSTTRSRTWEDALKGFRGTIFAWKEHKLDSMFQKSEVARIFAQSKLWYMSQVLPLPAAISKKIELLLSSFLFSSKPELLKLEELYNKPAKGGPGLLDIRKKAKSLFPMQQLLLNACNDAPVPCAAHDTPALQTFKKLIFCAVKRDSM